MVSPRSRPHNSVDHIEESNTTASLFLGGTRRNWMGPQNAPEKSATRNPHVELRVPPNSLTRELVMSPVTPGETPPSRGPVHTKIPDTRTTALPSPVLSTNSHPSPVGADAIISNRPYTLPPTPTLSIAQRGDDERMAVQPPLSGLATSQSVTQFPLMGPDWSTNSPPPTGTRTGASTEHTASGSRPSPQQNGGVEAAVISHKTWQQWSAQLDALVVDLRTMGALPHPQPGVTNVIRPRIDLLRQAISRKDAFYLVMHQLYCRYSIDPTTLGQIRAPEMGMVWLKLLLEDNRMMHDAATVGFAHFPESPQRLMQTKWYLQVLSGIPEFLSRLETEWQDIWRQAPHPPLVSHLWEALACPSPILMSVMFMCVARRLHNEKDIEPLLELFWKNFTAFKQCMEANLPGTTQTDINRHFAQEYRNFPRSSEYLPQTPSSSRSAPPRPQIQSMSQAAPGLPSPYPRSEVAGVSQSAIHSPALSPLGGPLQQSTSNSPQGPLVGPPAGSFQFGINSQVQNTPQHHYYNPMPQGQGQRQGQWYPANSHMNPNMNPQMQMHIQAALGQVSPCRTHQSPQVPHGQQMQRRAMMPTTSVVPVDPSLQSSALTSTQSAQSLHAPSPISATSTTTNQMVQQPMLPQMPNNHLNRQHSMNSQPSASPITRAPRRQRFQHSPNTAFLPVPGYRAPMVVNPNPMRLGLHLVDLRDPMKKLVKHGSHGNDIETDLFTYPETFVVYPTVINVDQPTYTWNFSFTNDERHRFPHITPGQEGQYSVWTFRPGCRNIRLRCIRLPGNPDAVTEQTWSTSGTFWPSVFYITVNGTELYVRRKVHHGKDLPLDITEYLQTGENSIRLDMILGQDECKTSKYVFGVEAMEIAEFDQILSLVQSVSAADSRAAIQKRLSPITNDDDLAVVTENLTIDLVDPFMARIFDVPVRSRHCNHHECFDRDTFIITRKSVSGPAPMVDNWRCPICKADARPQFLVVDQFLAEIHAQLTCTNRLYGVRAIQIKVDGTWTPKYDTDETSPVADKHFSPKRKAEDTPGPVATRPRNDVSNASRSQAVRIQEPTVIELD
ncbi:Zinc finger MIZ-type [Penicillium concentricum]|uniref:Zinc finger MIZ-type n=1 Tax=Penicillium concentricum TaxID=293559 RepID=A0A9W9SUE8_9EURO|nr:Zinc finger MIZ-type [Penicillium concentricum]KAJ5384858.1 Zinc finger MIZ-type [Penicillium concentricum]